MVSTSGLSQHWEALGGCGLHPGRNHCSSPLSHQRAVLSTARGGPVAVSGGFRSADRGSHSGNVRTGEGRVSCSASWVLSRPRARVGLSMGEHVSPRPRLGASAFGCRVAA